MTHIKPLLGGYKIRDIAISPGLVLAPMSGVTCLSFRRLIKEFNPGAVGLVITEFISVEAMTRQVKRSLDMMKFLESERPFAIQIFGYDIERMRDAALMVQDSGADIVDINCGCPAPKVVRKGGGCELMRQPEHLGKILKAVRSAVKMPLTLKMRAGWDHEGRNAVEIAHIAEQEGVEALAVHGRTRAQLYRGDADYDIVWRVRDSVKIPVLGSGDVVDQPSALTRIARTERGIFPERSEDRLSGVFIGRGAIANPVIFREIMTNTQNQIRESQELALSILERYIELLSEDFAPKVRIGRIKQVSSQMLRGYPWRKDMLRANTFAEQVEIVRAVRAGTWTARTGSEEGSQQEMLTEEVHA